MNSGQIKELDKEYIMQTYGRFPVAVARGDGARVYDPEGREYIDFSSGIGVTSVGYGNKKWIAAVTEQASRLAHISNLFYTEPSTVLAKRLCELSGLKKVFFSNSGAESNEGAIKLARKYGFDKYGAGRNRIVTLINSFHGRTISTLAATGQESFHNFFHPFTDGFDYVPADDFESLKSAVSDKVCAVLIELVQGEGGVNVLDKDYVRKVSELCAEKDVLLIVDEVQTGIGRTGTFFCFQCYGIKPDIVTAAKGIAGGLPMGAVLAGEKTENVLGAGTHASTFGGNPICAAAANAVLDILEGGVLAEVTEKGEYIREKISEMKLPQVLGLRGLGLMIGVAVAENSHKSIVSKLVESGLLCISAGKDAVRFLPPLTITCEEIDAGLEIFRGVLSEI